MVKVIAHFPREYLKATHCLAWAERSEVADRPVESPVRCAELVATQPQSTANVDGHVQVMSLGLDEAGARADRKLEEFRGSLRDERGAKDSLRDFDETLPANGKWLVLLGAAGLQVGPGAKGVCTLNEGSNRQLRGRILGLLLTHQSLTTTKIIDFLNEDSRRVAKIMESLRCEGFIQGNDGNYTISK